MLSHFHNIYIVVKMQDIISEAFDNTVNWNINGKGENKTQKKWLTLTIFTLSTIIEAP